MKRLMDLIAEKGRKSFVTVEYGIESTLNRTLHRINRQHSYEDTIRAIRQTKLRNIHTGGHLILGLPGESREEMLHHARRISEPSIDTLKLHQLQIVRHTTFAKDYRLDPAAFHLFDLEEYIDLVVNFLERLSPHIAVERFVNQAPFEMLIAPKWGLKNFEIVSKVEKKLVERNTWQGRLRAGGSLLVADE